MVFLVVLGVIALSKVSTSSTDYTTIFLLSVLTHLNVKKAKVRQMKVKVGRCARGALEITGKQGNRIAFHFSLKLRTVQVWICFGPNSFWPFLLFRIQFKPLLKGRQFSLFERWQTSKLPRYVLTSPPHYSLWSAITIHHSQ